MTILSHPTGNAFVRAAARALLAAGRLYQFHTAIATPQLSALRWLPPALRRQLQRRHFHEVPREQVVSHPWREAIRLAAPTLHLDSLTEPGGWAHPDAVYAAFDRRVAAALSRLSVHAGVSTVYCYEDAAEQTFHAARTRGLACVYELPIAHWSTTQRLLREEAERLPAWRPTLVGLEDASAKLARKDRELALADTVVVPSPFVLRSLPADVRASKRCILAPFGSPVPQPGRRRPAAASGRLRVLFAGTMTQRKGLADLFAAMRLLKDSEIQLVVMGTPVAAPAFYRSQYDDFLFEPTRPHGAVLDLMRTCDLLALPAIVEGRALVQQEALACGLPILVTANAGGEDLVEEGRTGFLVPIRSPAAIAERLSWFRDHRKELEHMRPHAFRKAAETGWSRYEARVVEAASKESA